jgi:voltage-gated potassium channel Kch
MPRDRDVDEPLEEVLLRRFRGAPGVLERLVRVEVLAAANLLEAQAEVFVHGAQCYARRVVATILLEGVDLFIRGKLEASLQGHHFVTSDSIEPPDLVIADIARTDPDEVADMYPDVPILGFSNHTDTAGLRRAHEAGFDQVVAKSALAERAPQLVEELIA